MRIEASIVAEWASQLSKDAVTQVVEQLMRMGPEMMQSGDSGLKNVWEEFCAQTQQEQSIFYDAYEVTIDGLLEQYIQTLSRKAQLALWSTSDQGWDWIYENFTDADGDRKAPLDTNLIIDSLRGDVVTAALDYESPSLYRYIWGADDDPEYDEEEDYEDFDAGNDAIGEGEVTSALVAWAPEGYSAPIELIAVMINPGQEVTHKAWIEALSDRVTNLVNQESNPERAVQEACQMLDLPIEDNPNQAGEALVKNNLNLLTHLNLAVMDSDPFPARVSEPRPEIKQALEQTNLASWVEQALSMVNESDLD